MNAYELADAMEIRASIRRKATSRKSVTEGANDRLADQLDQAATMLRQQEVEIERITSKYEEMLKEMLEKTNEPVAWMVAEMVFDTEEAAIGIGKTYDDEIIPLYTHPVNPYQSITNTKIEPTVVSYTHPVNLTSLEIADAMELVFGEQIEEQFVNDLEEFARAILRKAQEK